MEAQALGLTAPPVASTSGERSDSPKGFPLRTRIYRKDCGGTATDFSLTAYADATLLFVTQTGTAGTVFRAARDGAADGGSATYTTQVLLGTRDNTLLTVCVRQIVEQAGAKGHVKPMIIGLGLKQPSPQAIREVAQAVAEDNVWS